MKKEKVILICSALILIIFVMGSASALNAKIENGNIVVNLKIGQTLQKSINVINDNPYPVKIELIPTDEIKDSINIRNDNFILKPNSQKKAYFTIKAAEYGKTEGQINVKFTPLDGGNGVVIPAKITIIAQLGNEIPGDEAGQKLIEYLSQVNTGFSYNSYQDLGLLYGINLSYENETGIVYITKDGKYLIPFANQIDIKPNKILLTPREARIKLIDYLNEETEGGVKYTSYSDKGFLYEITVKYMGQKIPVYITKDGKYFSNTIYQLKKIRVKPNNNPCRVNTDCLFNQMCKVGKCINKPQQNNNTNNITPETEKPKVEIFVFSYCPYALQFEKGLFPVYDLLKNKADISIVFIGAMHGEVEHIESLRQICIEKNYNRDKLFSYLKEFDENSEFGSCSGTDNCINPLIEDIYTDLGIDKDKINNCMTKDAEAIYQAQVEKATNLEIYGSPTLVINGVQVETYRDSASLLKTICSSFKTQPSECSEELSSNVPSPGFGPTSSSPGGSGGSGGGATC